MRPGLAMMCSGRTGGALATRWNTADATSSAVISSGDAQIAAPSLSTYSARVLTAKSSGKLAISIEVVKKAGGYAGIGLASPSAAMPNFWTTSDGLIWDGDGGKYRNGYLGAFGSSFTDGDVVTVLYDVAAGTVKMLKNGVLVGSSWTGVPAGWKIAAYVAGSPAALKILDALPSYAATNGYDIWT